MRNHIFFLLASFLIVATYLPGQTTNGLITGLVTDSSGAVVPGAEIDAFNEGTGLNRSASTGDNGIYQVLQLPPGLYTVSAKKPGFATVNRHAVRLEVNQSDTVDFALGVSAVTQNVTVTGAPPELNTTSASLSNVIDHDATVGLPLNGRQFTQLVLLTPGAAPQQNAQQGTQVVKIGDALSPSVNGQRGYQNNFTMDGTLNNSTFTNVWAISPPPDAIQEFAVQSHITDAQFAISSGANVNLVTRSGTNAFHGSLWEFIRNTDLDAQTFPQTSRLPYRQNQYGVYFGGPVAAPRIYNGKDNTWFSFYWEGYRFNQTNAATASTLTSLMRSGNFRAELGTKVIGTDCLGRPEYANELYDPATSRPDPCHSKEYLRDPFMYNGQLNVVPPGRINAVIPTIISEYYPLPNLNVAEGSFPNFKFNSTTVIDQDIFGLRLDHKISDNDTVFLRFNRRNANQERPAALPTITALLRNYAQEAAFGYTHIFNPKTILNFRYGYTYVNVYNGDIPSGVAFDNSINFSAALPPRGATALGPNITIANGISGAAQTATPLGPLENMDYHADASRIVGNHTLGAGVMYYHLRSYDDGWHATTAFAQNATAQDGTAGPTGYGPASFLLGVLDNYTANVGTTSADQTVNWYGLYFQDQFQATKRLVLTAGLRWDYVSPPNYHKVVSGLNVLTGTYVVTGPVAGYYQQATGPSGFFAPQYSGYEPRFGLVYKATNKTVIHSAFAMLDDHNNTLVQENQNIRLSWPTGRNAVLNSLDLGIPTTYINNLPTASSLLSNLPPYASYGGNTNNRIPYSLEYNFGVQQQLPSSIVAKVDYVGSVSRFQYIVPTANTALTPGPGTVLSREPFPQYGGPFSFSWNVAPASYNGIEASIEKSLSSTLYFLGSYTYSKSMDWASDPYTVTEENFYDLKREWGPSTYSFKHMFVLSGLYTLPVGSGKAFLTHANAFTQALVGGWAVGEIFSARSGQPFNALAGADVANVGVPAATERAQRVPGVSAYTPKAQQSPSNWLNRAAFAVPAPYTYGNESRDDLFGPAYWDLDCDLSKNFHVQESMTIQFRAEAFNALNVTDYSNPAATVNSTTFGKITSAARSGRELQFALKLMF